jgi:hypothetical protein
MNSVMARILIIARITSAAASPSQCAREADLRNYSATLKAVIFTADEIYPIPLLTHNYKRNIEFQIILHSIDFQAEKESKVKNSIVCNFLGQVILLNDFKTNRQYCKRGYFSA